MIKTIIAFVAPAMALFSAVAIAADDAPLKAGDVAPDFTLKGSNGVEHVLSEQLKKTSVALIFYRSGAW